MYTAKIPGTKYMTSLETQGGQWYLRLKLDDSIESELEVEINGRAIKNKLGELFETVSLQINSFQVDLIHKELLSQIQHLLIQMEQNRTEPNQVITDETRYDPRVDALFDKIDKLETTLSTLNDRLERMESLTS